MSGAGLLGKAAGLVGSGLVGSGLVGSGLVGSGLVGAAAYDGVKRVVRSGAVRGAAVTVTLVGSAWRPRR
ncbi:hypothetical protein ACL02T_30140 [Pseudonocardia sp. RS010]|uniref:hypothetical protein n=1 Tax=Pseudonocardia sp. RS010 TaxID=3385979 RepID=UPI0039A1907F